MDMPVMSEVLERLGLSVYRDILVANGFHDWTTLVDITEEDLTSLRFKLGHRRALQREIATYRGIPTSESLPEPEGTTGDQASLSISALEGLSTPTSAASGKEKRRYRRHPRPDGNAPKKPKTAYVNFADELRAEPEISSLSFVDTAKEVGRRWQILPAEKKRIWESQAARSLQEYEQQMDKYKRTDLWREYQAYLIEFKAQQGPTTPARRPNSSRVGPFKREASSRGSPCSAASPMSLPPSTSEPDGEASHNALAFAFSEINSLRGEILEQGVPLYGAHHLPAEDLVHRAMHAFVRGTGSLLFMWTFTEVDEILDRIYRPEGPVDAMTMAECFIIAAMGAYYDLDSCPDHLRRILYTSATLHFHEKIARHDYLRTMRLLLSHSFYALLEKHFSARYLVAAGLQIARWQCPLLQSSNEPTAESWRRTFRSLIFMDCWLSYTLGYQSDITTSDISMACSSSRPRMQSTDELIHAQTSKVGLIAADIAKTLDSPELVTRENINMLTGRLEIWRAELPSTLQIPALTPSNPLNITLHQRRAILMVHVMYLGAIILLYRHLAVANAETLLTDRAAWDLDLSVDDAKQCRNQCAIAARQIAHLLSLISLDGTLTKRCWIVIYWAFTACIALLFSATTKLIDGVPGTVEQDLTSAKACMDILEPCRSDEPIADRYLKIVWPLYDHLRDIHQRIMGRVKTSIFSLLQADSSTSTSPPIPVSSAEMGPISEKLSELLTDPFGRKQGEGDEKVRRVFSQDGTCMAFWWK